MKIRQLRWRVNKDNRAFQDADGVWPYYYTIRKDNETSWQVYVGDYSYDHMCRSLGVFSTEENAKIRCQRDYENDVSIHLEPQ